jgi:hypothetical protein
MTRKIVLGEKFTGQFPVYESDGYTKKTGETTFTATVWKNAIEQVAAVTITEIGTSGEYKVQFTPNDAGIWEISVLIDYNKQIWFEQFEAGQLQVDWGMSAADDASNLNIAVWLEHEGERITNVTSVAAVIRELDGTQVVDLGTDSTPTTEGVFSFSTAITNITANTAYVLDCTAIRSSITYDQNIGFSKA